MRWRGRVYLAPRRQLGFFRPVVYHGRFGHALFQTISLFIFAGVVACLVWVIGSMNRNDILSRMSGSTPGELTWDRTLYANLALYGIVPAVTLISSQFPMLRETLFKWVDPLVKFVVSA